MKHRNKIIAAVVLLALGGFLVASGKLQKWLSPAPAYDPNADIEGKRTRIEELGDRVLDMRRLTQPELYEPREVAKPNYIPVDWPASSTLDWELRAKLPQDLLDKIDQSPVPVLLPSNPEIAKQINLGSYNDWHSARLETTDLTIYLIAQMVLQEREKYPFEKTVRGVSGDIWGGEGGTSIGWNISWIEHNTLYQVKVACTHCKDYTNEEPIRELIDSLTYVGGSGWNDWQE